MGAAAAPSGDDRRRVRELLATAQQYAVLEPRGKRIGAFIGLVGAGAEGFAIRHDGVFLWRRRVLPITAVAQVLPKQRAVVLRDDPQTLEPTDAEWTSEAGTSRSGDDDPPADGAWQERIARYVSVTNGGGDESDAEEDQRRNRSEQQADERHLLFVSTSHGYHLVERDGPPPDAFRDVTVSEHEGLFQVVKVAPSPFPNDPRVCFYVQQSR